MKTIEITALAKLGGAPEEVEAILTVSTDRVITHGLCLTIMKALYPNHQLSEVKFSIV